MSHNIYVQQNIGILIQPLSHTFTESVYNTLQLFQAPCSLYSLYIHIKLKHISNCNILLTQDTSHRHESNLI